MKSQMKSRRDDAYLDDDDTVVPDGHSVKVPVQLMDSVQRRFAFDATAHQPHFAQLTDELCELRAKTRAEYLASLRDACKSPAQRAVDSGGFTPPDARRHLSLADARSPS
jgi:hypothetical protein